MRRALLALCLLILASSSTFGAPSWLDLSFRGYLKDLLSLSRQEYGFIGFDGPWTVGNVLHTRQNFRLYPLEDVTCGMEVKTRFFRGVKMKSSLDYIEGPALEATYFDWTWNILDEGSSAIVTTIDRAYVDLYLGPTQSTVGRQRVAWGTNWVWNPIDLFNTISPLDYDTEERPGADAVRVQYYTSPTSKLEFAVAPGRDSERHVIAGLFGTNVWHYDLYLVGGSERSNAVVGGAWAGQIRGAGFRGEWLYGEPGQDSDYGAPFALAAASVDYTFPNSLFLQGELLYNTAGTSGDAGGERLWQAVLRNELSPARASVFGQVAYSFSPLVRGSLSSILNPFDHSWYLGPTVAWSLAANIDLSAMALFFGGRDGTEFGDFGEVFLATAKLSF
jgi:hypothetical protein